MVRRVAGFLYVFMCAWLVFAGMGRILLSLNAHLELDALPFIGGALGLTALVVGMFAMKNDDAP